MLANGNCVFCKSSPPPPSPPKPPQSGHSPTAATGRRTSGITGATGRHTSRETLSFVIRRPATWCLTSPITLRERESTYACGHTCLRPPEARLGMAGSGTTAVECKLLGRRAAAVDINPDAVMVARNRLDFSYAPLDADYVAPEIRTYVGDARSLDLIGSESVDLIATHPPYASIIPYSHDREGDLSGVHNIAEFAAEMSKVAQECMRVLKPGKHCAMLMGDTRRNKHFVPITPRVLMSFLEAGFILREDIIKLQWKMKSTREKWFGKKYDFYLIGHEHLYVFRKPDAGEKVTKFRESMKWW